MLQPGVRTSLSSGVLTGEESSPSPLSLSTVRFPCLCDWGFSSCRLPPRATLCSPRPSQLFTMVGFTTVVICFFKASNGGSNPQGEPTPLYKSPLIKSGPPLLVTQNLLIETDLNHKSFYLLPLPCSLTRSHRSPHRQEVESMGPSQNSASCRMWMSSQRTKVVHR